MIQAYFQCNITKHEYYERVCGFPSGLMVLDTSHLVPGQKCNRLERHSRFMQIYSHTHTPNFDWLTEGKLFFRVTIEMEIIVSKKKTNERWK